MDMYNVELALLETMRQCWTTEVKSEEAKYKLRKTFNELDKLLTEVYHIDNEIKNRK